MSTSISRDGEPLPPYVPAGAPPVPEDLYRARVGIAIALHAEKHSLQEIADIFQVHKRTVGSWLARARAEGKLREDLDALLDVDTAFRALSVVHDKLEEGNLEAALAILKGRGKLRTYTNSTAAGGTSVTGIQIVYTTPSGAPPPQLTDIAILPGQIIGTPRSDPAKP